MPAELVCEDDAAAMVQRNRRTMSVAPSRTAIVIAITVLELVVGITVLCSIYLHSSTIGEFDGPCNQTTTADVCNGNMAKVYLATRGCYVQICKVGRHLNAGINCSNTIVNLSHSDIMEIENFLRPCFASKKCIVSELGLSQQSLTCEKLYGTIMLCSKLNVTSGSTAIVSVLFAREGVLLDVSKLARLHKVFNLFINDI
jgi:hypothetical protein